MSLPKPRSCQYTMLALSILGLGCLLCTSGTAHGQQPIQLGRPLETPTEPLPRTLPPLVEPVRIGTVKQETLPPPSIIAVPSEDPNPVPRLLELPARINEKKNEDTLDHVVNPETSLDLVVGIPRLLIMRDKIERAQIGGGDDRATPATFEVTNQRELSLLGRRVGRTVLNIWFNDPTVPGKHRIVSYLVRVLPDDQPYRDMEKLLNDTFPQSHIELKVVGNNLLVMGQARNAAEAAQIMKIVQPAVEHARPKQEKDDPARRSLYQEPEIEQRPPLTAVNMLQIPGEQQVMLKVVITEVNRSAIRNMGVSIPNDQSLPTLLDSNQLGSALGTLRKMKLAHSLYETTLVTSNGQAAKLQDGGSFPVPSAGNSGATAAAAGVQYVPFGVSMTFVPTITDKDQVVLNMVGEVSSRDFANRTWISGAVVPNLTKHSFQSIVEVREGQSLAVAGVTQNNYTTRGGSSSYSKIPLLAGLFSNERSRGGEQELIITVTPELLRPKTHTAARRPWPPATRKSKVEPNLHGRESQPIQPASAAVLPDPSRMNVFPSPAAKGN